jgi:hypothetical protein
MSDDELARIANMIRSTEPPPENLSIILK